MQNALLAAASLALVAGCSVTPKDLEGAGGSTFVVEVPSAPAVTYRQLVTRMRDCYADKAFTVDADFFPDIQTGRVTIGTTRATLTFALLRLEPAPAGATTMRVSYHDRFARHDDKIWRDSVVAWAHGQDGYCVLDELRKPPPPRADRP